MELSFSNSALRDICEKREAAVAAIGESAALELEERLADIDAMDTVDDLALMYPGEIIDRTPDERALRLKSGYDLVFRAGHAKRPVTQEGATDWSEVSRIRVVAIESKK